MGKTLAELALAGFAALGMFGTNYAGPQQQAYAVQDEQSSQKMKVPSDNELMMAEKEIRDLYKAEYALKDPAKRKAFAEKLLANARETQQPAYKFILLRDAAITLTDMLEFDGAYDAVRTMKDSFDGINVLENYEKHLIAAKGKVKTKDEATKLANAYLSLTDDAVAEKNYKLAMSTAKSAETISKKAGDASLLERATDLIKSIPEMEKEYSLYKKAQETLENNPNDPEANAIAARYKGFVEGDWEAALKHFSKSNNGISRIADQEILLRSGGMDNPEAVRLVADLWYDLSNKTTNALDKRRFATHAFELYQHAKNKATGLTKDKIAKRISELEKKVSPTKNGAVKAGGIDLMPFIDLKKAIKGTWTFSNGSLISPPIEHAQLPIQYTKIPKEYDLYLTVSRISQTSDSLFVGLVKDNYRIDICFDNRGGVVTEVDFSDPTRNKDPPYRKRIFTDENPRNIVCKVRKHDIRILVNNEQILKWEPDYDNLKNFFHSVGTSLFVGSHKTSYCISELRLVPITK